MKRTLHLPRREYRGNTYRGEISLELKKEDGRDKQTVNLKPAPAEYYTFSASGGLYILNEIRWDVYSFGQNIEEIATVYSEDSQVQRIRDLWKRYHLNDMKVGTLLQMAAITRYEKANPKWRYEYGQACEILKEIDRKAGRPVAYCDRGYKYGHEWLVEIIPGKIVLEIMDIIGSL